MNSACAVVASHAIGSVPFLVEDGKNGLINKDGDTEDLYNKVKYFLEHPHERREMAKNAYRTMTEDNDGRMECRKCSGEVFAAGGKHPPWRAFSGIMDGRCLQQSGDIEG